MQVFVRKGFAAVEQNDNHIGLHKVLPDQLYSLFFNDILRRANACRVRQVQTKAVYGDIFGDQVACRAGNVGDDGFFLAGQTVEQTGFAHVRLAGNDDGNALRENPGRLVRG